MNFSLADLAAAAGAFSEGGAELTGAAVDSRQVRPGDLFVAIRGARVDGHDFAGEAAARGARALLG
jgi:UDP-N-acetylmuramoyl-tripeptide--D-alanyl-D-alanine ligase